MAFEIEKFSEEFRLERFADLRAAEHTGYLRSKTKALSHRLAEQLEREHPEHVVSKMGKNLRTGKVFVDWSQNDRHKTTVCAYSLRAKEQPTGFQLRLNGTRSRPR